MMDKCINIVYAINDLYAPAAAASLFSVWYNTSKKNLCIFYLLYFDLSINMHNKFKQMSDTYGIKIKLIKVTNHEIKALKEIDYLTKEMYLRLTIGKLLVNESKALYLDSDTIVNSDIIDLYSVNIDETVLGVIKDVPNIYRTNEIKKMGLEPDKYFNSGVLLINLKLFRNGYFEKILSQLKKDVNMKYPDQDALNKIFVGKVKYIDLSWNFQWGHYLDQLKYIHGDYLDEYKSVMNKFNLIHYTSCQKPWNSFAGKKLTCYFFRYASFTPFWEDVIESLVHIVSLSKRAENVNEIIIDKLRNGKLGFSDIQIFIKEWIKFKIKKQF